MPSHRSFGFVLVAALLGFTILTVSGISIDVGTFLGGSRGEGGYRLPIAFDAAGNVYVAGCTESADLPVTDGAWQPVYGGRGDMFVAKLSPQLDRILACTYVGGSLEDGEWASVSLVLGDDGTVYVAGATVSDDLETSEGAIHATRAGEKDVYVARFSEDLTTLLSATYYGGTRAETYLSMAFSRGALIVAGSTTSRFFPSDEATATPRGRSGDLFVCRLAPDLTETLSSRIIPAPGDDICEGLDVGSDGTVYLAGWTSSQSLPTSDRSAIPSYAGGTYDGFALRLSPDLDRILAATYFGGSDWDFIYAIDARGDSLWVAGHTASRDLPNSAGTFQPAYNGGAAGRGDDGFIARLSSDLSHIHAATYFGGSGWEIVLGLRALANEVVFVGGTSSRDLPLTSAPMDDAFSGPATIYAAEGFVGRLDTSLRTLREATYLGGSGMDSPGGLVVDAAGRIWIIGSTTSEDLELPSPASSFQGGTWRREGGLWGGELFLVRLAP